MFVPLFTLNLNQKILPGRVTIGEYDGKHPCLTAATIGEKVFIHNPHQRIGGGGASRFSGGAGRMDASQASQEMVMLNINQRVTALSAGNLNPQRSNNDILLIGTPTNLLAYDVERNADLFYKEVPDGVNVLTVGLIGTKDIEASPLAIVGGNCSIQGFDSEGNDPFWTVTGDNVSSLALMDYNRDGKNELIVGSEDFEIRIFAEDEILSEITETEAVTALTHVQDGRFGYALANGTVGVYEKTTRWWRIKSKNSATAIYSYDLDGDGVKELITGWSNGKIDARNDRTGEVVFKDNFNHPIAGLTQGDYRMDGRLELVVCGTEGEVRGYLPSNIESRNKLLDIGNEQENLRELMNKKQNLILELKNYEENQKIAMEGVGSSMLSRGSVGQGSMGVIPAQTQLSTVLSINLAPDGGKAPHVEVSLTTSNDTVIRGVLIFAEGIFEGECHVVHPRENLVSSTIVVPIIPPRDVPVDLHIKAFVGYKGSKHFHVFELTRQLPRFSMYCRIQADKPVLGEGVRSSSPGPIDEDSKPPPPNGFLNFHINERVARVAMWINQNFLVGEELEAATNELSGGSLELQFISLRNKEELYFNMSSDGNVSIKCNNMDLCGDLVQALAEYLGLDDLKSTCDFPDEFQNVEPLLAKADGLQTVRQRLSAEMADNSGLIRTFIVRAEDSRLMMDMKNMRKWYAELYDLNRDLISGYKIRCNNHQELMDTLKQVNQIIQKAGRLRVGKSKAKVISDCRSAIKGSNVSSMLKVMKTGEA